MSHKGRVFYHAYHKTYGRSDKRWRSDRWNIWGNSGTIYRKIVAHGRDLSDFIFSDFEPWKFVIALYKVGHVKSPCYSSWACICSKVELLTRTWALTLMPRTFVTSYLNHLLLILILTLRWVPAHEDLFTSRISLVCTLFCHACLRFLASSSVSIWPPVWLLCFLLV